MPDSIFDLKQTLFTSNLPVPAPRDRGSDGPQGFDKALHTAQNQTSPNQTTQNQSRDDHHTNDSQPAATSNYKPAETDQTDDAPAADQDQVTLSEQGVITADTAAVKPTKGAKKPDRNHEKDEATKEPTAEEIAAAAIGIEAPPKPVLNEQPKLEQSKQHEGIELKDAVQQGSKRRVKPPASGTSATTNANNQAAAKVEEPTAASTEESVVDSTAGVIATALQTTQVATAKPNDGKEKPGQAKATNKIAAQPITDATKSDAAENSAGAFAITETPDTERETLAPKRRLETTRQTIPESNNNDDGLKLAAQVSLNATAVTSANDIAATGENAAKSAETPSISDVSTTPNDSAATPNFARTQQIPNSFSNRLEAAAAERKSNDSLNGVDRTRFVQRVARAFQRAGENEGEIRLRLSPPELGAVKLEVTLRDGTLTARMETETTTARNLLLENLPQLKEKLAEQNIRIETFEVAVRDQSQRGSAEDAQEQLKQQQEQQRNRPRGERATAPVITAPIVRTLPAARQSSQLNVVI